MSSPQASGRVRRGGRPQKYDWSDKRDICHKLFVEEKKSAPQIAQWFADHFGVDPSQLPNSRDFLRQFKRWGFPSRKVKLGDDETETLVARLRELWEQNIPGSEINEIIRTEGWGVLDRDVYNLRKKHGLLLRVEHGFAAIDPNNAPKKRKVKRRLPVGDDLSDQASAAATAAAATAAADQLQAEASAANEGIPGGGMTTGEIAWRAQRMAEVQMESDERLRTGKRRRRIRGYSHLPADEPGLPPRYNSETSLDECKAFLMLDNTLYQQIREQFSAICTEYGIMKKTQCEPGVWQGAKDRLIRENMHLSAIFNPLHPDLDRKTIALENICADVTKRLRILDRQITIADANNGLGLNPQQSKEARRALYEILAANHFESRLLVGEERWQEMRRQWHATSPLLQQAASDGNDELKARMLNVLIRDAMKRYQDDRRTKDPSATPRYSDANYGPGPGPVRRGPATGTDTSSKASTPYTTTVPKKRSRKGTTTADGATGDPNLDPSLRPPDLSSPPPPPPPPPPVPAFFRLSPESQVIGNHPKMWLGKLAAPTVAALHTAATSNAGAASVAKVQGIVRNGDGSEDLYQIDDELELQTYIAAAEGSGKATFLVTLEGGYA